MLLLRRHLLASLAGLASWPAMGAARTAPPPLLLAESAPAGLDPRPFLVSEKYDGVRALWDGRCLRFRSGREVHAPAWFTARLPPLALDGELWLGRGRFDVLSGIVRRNVPVDEAWRKLRYMAFELPDAPGSFAERCARLRTLAQRHADSPMIAVAQERVDDGAALKALLDQVVRGGGEGLMLHRADAAYVTGRSNVLLKLKPLADAEATVIEIVAGQGKYAGLMGALWLQTPEGRRFKLGTGFSDELRRHPPAVGNTVTYAYRGLTSDGLPRFASFARLHEEL
jgi:DNA ligase-1